MLRTVFTATPSAKASTLASVVRRPRAREMAMALAPARGSAACGDSPHAPLDTLVLVSTSGRELHQPYNTIHFTQAHAGHEGTCWLHADDLDVRPNPLDVRCDAGDQPAASDRHEYR